MWFWCIRKKRFSEFSSFVLSSKIQSSFAWSPSFWFLSMLLSKWCYNEQQVTPVFKPDKSCCQLRPRYPSPHYWTRITRLLATRWGLGWLAFALRHRNGAPCPSGMWTCLEASYFPVKLFSRSLLPSSLFDIFLLWHFYLGCNWNGWSFASCLVQSNQFA